MLISASASSETIQTPGLRQPDHLLHHRLGLGDGDQDEPRMDQVERVWRQSTPARITLAHQHVVELSLADQLSRQLDVSRFNVEADHPPRRPHALRQHLERSPRATPDIDRLRSGAGGYPVEQGLRVLTKLIGLPLEPRLLLWIAPQRIDRGLRVGAYGSGPRSRGM